MNFSEQISEGITVDRVPDACYDCGNVIPRGGAFVLGESGRVVCHKCLGIVLDDSAAKPAHKEGNDDRP